MQTARAATTNVSETQWKKQRSARSRGPSADAQGQGGLQVAVSVDVMGFALHLLK